MVVVFLLLNLGSDAVFFVTGVDKLLNELPVLIIGKLTIEVTFNDKVLFEFDIIVNETVPVVVIYYCQILEYSDYCPLNNHFVKIQNGYLLQHIPTIIHYSTTLSFQPVVYHHLATLIYTQSF